MKFAAHDRGTARTLLRTATSPVAPMVVNDEREGGRLHGSTRQTDTRHQNTHDEIDVEISMIPHVLRLVTGHTVNAGRGDAARCRECIYSKGQHVFDQNSGQDLFYIVRAGCIRLYKTLADGRSINIGLFGPDAVFTQEDRRDGLASGVIAEALVDSTVSVIGRDGLVTVINQSPELALALIDNMTRRLTDVQGLVEQILARDVTLRLASILLLLAERFGQPITDGFSKIELPVPHQLLANMIGSNRVTVTRKLSDLRSQNLVRVLGRNTIAVHIDDLRGYARAAQEAEAN